MEEILYNAGIGAVASCFIAGAGYFKSIDATKPEGFDAVKFLKTVILGAAVGGIATATGLQPDLITALPMYAGVTAVLENALKGLFRRL